MGCSGTLWPDMSNPAYDLLMTLGRAQTTPQLLIRQRATTPIIKSTVRTQLNELLACGKVTRVANDYYLPTDRLEEVRCNHLADIRDWLKEQPTARGKMQLVIQFGISSHFLSWLFASPQLHDYISHAGGERERPVYCAATPTALADTMISETAESLAARIIEACPGCLKETVKKLEAKLQVSREQLLGAIDWLSQHQLAKIEQGLLPVVVFADQKQTLQKMLAALLAPAVRLQQKVVMPGRRPVARMVRCPRPALQPRQPAPQPSEAPVTLEVLYDTHTETRTSHSATHDFFSVDRISARLASGLVAQRGGPNERPATRTRPDSQVAEVGRHLRHEDRRRANFCSRAERPSTRSGGRILLLHACTARLDPTSARRGRAPNEAARHGESPHHRVGADQLYPQRPPQKRRRRRHLLGSHPEAPEIRQGHRGRKARARTSVMAQRHDALEKWQNAASHPTGHLHGAYYGFYRL